MGPEVAIKRRDTEMTAGCHPMHELERRRNIHMVGRLRIVRTREHVGRTLAVCIRDHAILRLPPLGLCHIHPGAIDFAVDLDLDLMEPRQRPRRRRRAGRCGRAARAEEENRT